MFPELSLTGYVLDADPIAVDDPVLAPLVAVATAAGAIVVAGAPVADPGGGRAIGMLAIAPGGVSVCARKQWLGGDEPAWFAASDGPATIEVGGRRAGLGICRDTGVAAHVEAVAARRVDLYAAGLVHAPDELGEQDRRGRSIAARLGVPVAFASAAGPVRPAYPATAGTSTIWRADGTVAARAGRSAGEVAAAFVDLPPPDRR